METKDELRKQIKKQRVLTDISLSSARIAGKFRCFDRYIKAKNVMLFYPMEHEINLLDLLNDNKNFYFPRVNGKELLVCPAGDKFQKSKFNIYEPCTTPVEPKFLDLVIVPALAVDSANYRLGYGGGFYDRFLCNYPEIDTVVPIQKEFIYDEFEHDKYDVPVDYVITD